ncbi:hypothetical protein ACWDSD_35210 [Streptomyces spiralis]
MYGLIPGQQPFGDRLVAARRVIDGPAGAVFVHLAGGLRGLLCALRLGAQGGVTAHVGPQAEGAGLALVEFGEEGEVGLRALLVGAERVPEFDELQAQDVGLKVVGHDPLRDLPPPLRPPGCCMR